MKKTIGVLSLIVMILSQVFSPFAYAVSGEEVPIPEPVVEEVVPEPEVEEPEVVEPEVAPEVENSTGDNNFEVVEPSTGEVADLVEPVDVEVNTGTLILTGGEAKNLEEEESLTGTEASSGFIEKITESIKDFLGINGEEDSFESHEIYGTGEYEGVKVEVYAQTGLFASGTELTIEPVVEEKLQAVQEVLLSGEVDLVEEKVIAFDITFRDPETQEELQPKDGTVQVKFNYEENDSLVQAEEDAEQEVKVYHLNDIDEEGEKIEEITGAKLEEVIINEEKSEEENVMVVEANSFSIYTIVVQVEEGLDNQLADFTWEDIEIRDPNNPYSGFTIMDRNLGASSRYGRGYFYQFGNNYGFKLNNTATNASIVNGRTGSFSTDAIEWKNSYLNSGFVSKVFGQASSSYPYVIWKDNKVHKGVWGGANDKAENNFGLDLKNYDERQGPCPNGYHVPSIGEWNKLIEFRSIGKGLQENLQEQNVYYGLTDAKFLKVYGEGIPTLFANELFIPYGAYYSSNFYYYGYSNYRILLSSSDEYYGSYANSMYDLYLGEDPSISKQNMMIQTQSAYSTYAYQLRCFKNVYEQPDVYKINFHLNGEVTEKNVIGGEKLTIPTLIPRDGYIIDGWYTDSDFTNEYDFSSLVTENIDLYAREIPFEYGIIYLSDPDNLFSGFAIMDRNLGAKESGTGKSSYGYLYQWGNNYGFPVTGFLDESYKKLQWNDSYNNSGYFSTGFYGMGNSVWSDGNLHGGLRGGSGDAQTNNRGLDNISETVVNRKGPCPEGWHVPSIGERGKALEYRKMNQYGYSYNDINLYKQEGIAYMYLYNKRYNIFLNDLKLPFGGYRTNGNYLYGQGDRVFDYRSSSPSGSYIKYLYTQNTAGFFIGSYSADHAYSVRCFKNDYEPPINTISFETFEGNAFDSKSVLSGKQLRLNAQPSRNGYYFGGWYTDEELTIPYDFSLPVNNDFTLYAKWNSPVVVSFQTNGGIAFDNEYIEPGKTLQLKSDPQKYGYFFKGWYTDEELTIPYDFSLPVNNDFTLYAKWDNHFGTISISDPNNSLSGFTIMDRNLGAKEAGTGEDSYGYLFQWGNNYGFLNNPNINTTTLLAEWNDKYENNGYYGTQFITTTYGPYDYWSGSYFHDGLWGGSGDNENTNWGLDNISETVNNRRGPCPEGWHVPSAGEWSKLLEYFFDTYNKDNATNKSMNYSSSLTYSSILSDRIIEYFMLPQAGYLYQSSNNAYKSSGNGYYWSSSPGNNNTKSPFTFYFYNSYFASNNVYNRTQGNSIRCFKNNYERQDEYTLLLDTNGGNSIDDMEIRANHKLTGLPKPTRDNSIFEGWYLNDAFTDQYDFNQFISGNLKFYAKWSCISGYTLSEDLQSCEKISVKFRANGGTFGNSDIYTIKSIEKLEIGNVIKVSHTSNIDDNGNSNSTYDNNLNTNGEVITITGAQSLKITIVHGTESTSWDWVSMWTGAHPDYTAKNHYSSSIIGNNGKLGGSRDTLQTNVYEVEGDTVTFSFASDGGVNYYGYYATISGTGEKYITTYSGDAFDNIPEPVREGYTFKGWYFDNETFEHEFNESEVVTGESMNVYAKWIPNSYTIKFLSNNGENNIISQSFTYNLEQNLTKNNYTYNGYSFFGWNTKSDGSGTGYLDEELVVNLTGTDNGIINLYAQWNEELYIIEYNLGEDESLPEGKLNPIKYTINSGDITLINPIKTGYTFKGWTGTDIEDKILTVIIPQGSTGNRSYTPQFQENIYTIKYVSKEGIGNMSDIMLHYTEEGVIAKNQFIRTGYQLSYWLDGDRGVRYYPNQKISKLTGDNNAVIILTAQRSLIPPAAGGGKSIIPATKEQEHNVAEEKQEEKQESNQDKQQEEQSKTPENINTSNQTSTQQSSSSSKDNIVTIDPEIQSAYEWAYERDVTTIPSLDDAMPDGVVKRGHLAKMVVNYATNVLGREIPEKIPSECRWNDWRKDWESEEIKDYAVKSCALGLMGLDMPKFLPNMEVTRAQFGTIMSRLLWGKKYAGGTPYYRKHLNALKENNIMTQIENPEKRVELRQWVWLMLMRSAENN